MKCSLCGSKIEGSICTFCGMPAKESLESAFEKENVAKVIKEIAAAQKAEQVSINILNPPAVYEEHYQRRHIHSEHGGGVTVSSLMIKAVLLIILSIVAYMFIISGPTEGQEGDMPENRMEDTVLVLRGGPDEGPCL